MKVTAKDIQRAILASEAIIVHASKPGGAARCALCRTNLKAIRKVLAKLSREK